MAQDTAAFFRISLGSLPDTFGNKWPSTLNLTGSPDDTAVYITYKKVPDVGNSANYIFLHFVLQSYVNYKSFQNFGGTFLKPSELGGQRSGGSD
jgi:hypothetical protein